MRLAEWNKVVAVEQLEILALNLKYPALIILNSTAKYSSSTLIFLFSIILFLFLEITVSVGVK